MRLSLYYSPFSQRMLASKSTPVDALEFVRRRLDGIAEGYVQWLHRR